MSLACASYHRIEAKVLTAHGRFMPVSSSLRRTFSRTSISHTFSTVRKMTVAITNGDLNNTAAERSRREIVADPAYHGRSFAIPISRDDPLVREKYRPFLLDDETPQTDWVAQLELSTALKMVESQVLDTGDGRLRILVLHGSMRKR